MRIADELNRAGPIGSIYSQSGAVAAGRDRYIARTRENEIVGASYTDRARPGPRRDGARASCDNSVITQSERQIILSRRVDGVVATRPGQRADARDKERSADRVGGDDGIRGSQGVWIGIVHHDIVITTGDGCIPTALAVQQQFGGQWG